MKRDDSRGRKAQANENGSAGRAALWAEGILRRFPLAQKGWSAGWRLMGENAMRGSAYGIVLQMLKFGLNLFFMAMLARILAPADFGVLAAGLTLVGFLMMFQDLGIQTAIIQRRHITEAELNALFIISVGTGVFLALLCVALAAPAADFFNEPRLERAMPIFGAHFLLTGLSVQPQALLSRQMKFRTVALMDFLSGLAGYATALLLALGGLGYFSLFWQFASVAAALLALSYWRSGWRPGRERDFSRLGETLSFGKYFSAYQTVNYVARNYDNLLIGYVFPSASLGFYHKAYQLMRLPVMAINLPILKIGLPLLSGHQSDPETYRAHYNKLMLIVTALGMPWVIFFLLEARAVVLLIFGDQWLAVVDLFRLLGPLAFIDTFNLATGLVHMTLGRARRLFWWETLLMVVVLIGFTIGIAWGMEGVAIAASAIHVAMRFPSMLFCFRDTPITVRGLLRIVARPAFAALAAGGVYLLALPFLDGVAHPFARLLLGAPLYGLLYVVAWIIQPGWLHFLKSTAFPTEDKAE